MIYFDDVDACNPPSAQRRRVLGHLRHAVALACLFQAGCGGDGGGSASTPVMVAPAPTPAPSPTPTPTPTPASATLSYLHAFATVPGDAAGPAGPLLQANDGNFYGIASGGGANTCRSGGAEVSCGAVFRITPSGQESLLHSFGGSASAGFNPNGPLIQGTDGALYGVTTQGGTNGGGTVYRLSLGGNLTILYSFGATTADGVFPTGGVTQAPNGDLFGVTSSGGANTCRQIPRGGGNCGTIYRITAAGAKTTIYSFGTSATDGVTPNGPLLLAPDGNLYGTTVNGGANSCSDAALPNSCGTVFKISASGGAATILYSFGRSALDGIAPQGSLIIGSDGAFYGTTASGGGGLCDWPYGCGTVFRMTAAGAVTVIHTFAQRGYVDGSAPAPYLVQGRDGFLYGTTRSGGAFGGSSVGTVFRMTTAGDTSILYSFGPILEMPTDPLAGVIQASDGNFYGVTAYNGRYGSQGAYSGIGTVFRLRLP